MSIKEKIKKMPVWKAAVCGFLMIFVLFFAVEEILAHSVFHILDRMIVSLEKENQDDLKDMDEWDTDGQGTNCVQYEALMRKKLNLQKWDKNDFLYQDKVDEFKRAQQGIENSIKYEHFNLEKCKKALQDKSS